MSDVHESTFIIAREDRTVAPKTILSDGLRIGRLPDSDVWLNHPTVSRLHAGISKIEDYFYLINLSASSATTLNGRAIPFNESDALVDGDVIRIGPFFLNVEQTDGAFKLRFSLQFALNVAEGETQHRTKTMVATPKVVLLRQRIVAASTKPVNPRKILWDR